MNAHTPGPWRIWKDMDPKEPVQIIGMETDFICQIAAENTQAKANAALIAAAPDLLSVCREASEFVKWAGVGLDGTSTDTELLARLDAAIAKAEPIMRGSNQP